MRADIVIPKRHFFVVVKDSSGKELTNFYVQHESEDTLRRDLVDHFYPYRVVTTPFEFSQSVAQAFRVFKFHQSFLGEAKE